MTHHSEQQKTKQYRIRKRATDYCTPWVIERKRWYGWVIIDELYNATDAKENIELIKRLESL